jgi:prepilin-type processing-associated H-X9-DG protein
MAVAADRNPWINSPAGKVKDFASFKPDIEPWNATPQAARKGNSLSHGQDGQNVLFLDGHVSFEERPYCGLDKDNVYTCSSDFTRHGDALGFQPVAGPAFAPMNRRDSLLVHDPAPLYSEVVSQQAPSVDSKDLQQTAVVATLDCPLPEHKNAIWCSTFQIAWDRFRLDVIGEPLQVVGAEDLASRLNHGLFPMGDMEAKSWYAAAGFVSKGITKQIQKEMSRRFPSEPVPVFDQRYRTLEDGVLAYAYLNVDVGFTHPYYTLPVAFNFEDSNGTRAGVTAFCAQNEIRAANHQQIRDQVEVLYDDTSESAKTAEFAVDLCRHTQPYQVILARIPRANTLGETARTLRDKIAAFKDDPDYQALRKLRANDTLVVPDVLYKLTHHFDELLNKPFANARWRLYFFFEAMQKIDFTLSRTGVILRSEAGLGGTSAVKRNIQEPRRLHFDKPFLICVTKRDADASPFFLMWVDNAELMKRY